MFKSTLGLPSDCRVIFDFKASNKDVRENLTFNVSENVLHILKMFSTHHGPVNMDWTSSLFSFRSTYSKYKLLAMSYSHNRLQ